MSIFQSSGVILHILKLYRTVILHWKESTDL